MENRNVPQDETHPLSEKQTNTDNNKLATATAVLTDPKFPLPTLGDKSSTLAYVKSFAVLSCLLGGGVFGAWFMGMSLLQPKLYGLEGMDVYVLAAAWAGVMGMMFWTGTVWVDWWELVLGYWWLSMPVGAAAGLAFVLNQERTAQIIEVD